MQQANCALDQGGKNRRTNCLGLALAVILTAAVSAQAGGRFYFTVILTNSASASGQNSDPEHITDTGYICGTAPYGDAWQAARWNLQGVICELGVYDPGIDTVSDAFGLNDAGDIAGSSSHDVLSADNAVIFRGTNIVRVPLNDAGQAKAVNNGGCAVGYTVDFLGRAIAWIWNGSSNGVEYLGDINYDGENFCAANANAINNHTQVVGNAINQLENQSRAFIWTPAAGLALLPAVAGRALNYARTVKDSGAMLGYSANGGNEDKIAWTRSAGGIVSILPDTAAASNHNVQGMNEFGVIVGNSQTSGYEEWRGAIYDSVRGWRFLHELIGADASRYDIDSINALGINDRGQIVGTILGNDGHYYGILFSPVAARRNDFDGDGKSDPCLYDPAGGNWLVFLSGSGYAPRTLVLGGANLPALAADFDGDGKADPAVYDAANAELCVRLSGEDYSLCCFEGLGAVGFEALAADFDGDGKADPAVYEETTGIWLYRLSNQNYAAAGLRAFGGSGFRPAPGDYDGDRKTDFAIYYEATGSWFIRLSATCGCSELYVELGGPDCEPVYGDFDGDGLIDPAIYNESAGYWAAQMSATGLLGGTFFGGPGMLALPVDFDGDGLNDPAVYRAAGGLWRAAYSGNGYLTQTGYFGPAGYIPLR